MDAPEAVLGLEIGEGDILPLICCGDLELNRGLPIGETGQDMYLARASLQSEERKRNLKSYLIYLENTQENHDKYQEYF